MYKHSQIIGGIFVQPVKIRIFHIEPFNGYSVCGRSDLAGCFDKLHRQQPAVGGESFAEDVAVIFRTNIFAGEKHRRSAIADEISQGVGLSGGKRRHLAEEYDIRVVKFIRFESI